MSLFCKCLSHLVPYPVLDLYAQGFTLPSAIESVGSKAHPFLETVEIYAN